MNEQLNEYLYIARITARIVLRQFTFLLGEIKRQLVKAPLGAAISSYLTSLTHPAHA